MFAETYGVTPNGNVPKHVDAHGELTNKNVLLRSKSFDELAKEFKMTVPQFQKALNVCYEELKKKRDTRPRPHLVRLLKQVHIATACFKINTKNKHTIY